MTALPCQRHHFFLPDDFHYLNRAYMGPLPKAAERAGIEGQFPGNVYPWRRLVEEKGGELRVVVPAGAG